LIFEAFIGGWIHREAYGGKYLLDFKEVSDKLMIKFGKLCSWASASATGTWSEANGEFIKDGILAKSLRIRVIKTTSTSPNEGFAFLCRLSLRPVAKTQTQK
jgi:hypothetical protein